MVDIRVPVEEIRKRSLFVAVPMYGGVNHGIFCRSMIDLTALMTSYGIRVVHHMLFNESLVQRARNYCVDEFLRSDCTHMMFIDSDIGFNAQDVLTMLAMQSDDSEYDILTGPYPKKCISHAKVVQAVNMGLCDDNPANLERFVGDYVFNPVAGATSFSLSEPVEILEGGTGFMMIRRKTFENFAKAYPELSYRPDHVRSENFDGSREIHAYFDCVICPDTKRYLSEDYFFCQYARKAGMKVWLLPWMKLQHAGSYIFGGSLADIAMIGASPTCDPSAELKKRSR